MFKKYVERIVAREIERRSADIPARGSPPNGYNPLEAIRGGMLQWVSVPFNGVPVWCELRCLNATQLDACGGMTLIDVSGRTKVPTSAEMIDMRNKQEALVAAVLNRPSFDEIVKDLTDRDFVIRAKRKELEEIRSIDISVLPPHQAKELKSKMDAIELFIGFLIPEDAFGFLTSWALGVDVTDVKKVSRDKLLEAAILATNGHNDPHDHITGIFTDRDKSDIDKTAWSVYADYKREKEIEKSSGTRWIRGGHRG